MAVSIGGNLNALMALRRLDEASSARSRTFERLSTGSRVNRASDDAAGLAVASTLNAKARIYTQALRNVNDGISYLNVADGGMRELKSVLIRLRELSTQSSNGSFSNVQRRALDKEAQALQGEYNRIIDTTRFNRISVFENETLLVQAGVGEEGTLAAALVAPTSVTRWNGTFQAYSSFTSGFNPWHVSVADLNGDGVLDLVSGDSGSNTLSVLLGNGDGTFQARRSFASGTSPWSVSVADLNGDGVLDLVSADYNSSALSVLLGNGDGTFQARRSFDSGGFLSSVSAADLNGDGKLDLVSVTRYGDVISVLTGNGDGTFQARQTFVSGANPRSVSVGDFNGDGVPDLVAADQGDNTLSVLLGNGDGTFQARRSFASGSATQFASVADFNDDGVLDLVSADYGSSTLSVLLGNGDGTFQARRSFASGAAPSSVAMADFDGDGKLDLVSADYFNFTLSLLLGNGDGTFQARRTISSGAALTVAVADLNGDGVLDLVSADNNVDTVQVILGEGTTTTVLQNISHISDVSVATRSQALKAQGRIDLYLENVNAITGVVGSALSRFHVAANLLSASAEVTKAAESRIRDVDVAEESARLVSTGILQETASAVLAHALKGPELAIKLLRA